MKFFFFSNFVRKMNPVQVLSSTFREIFKNIYFAEHLLSAASRRRFLLLIFHSENSKIRVTRNMEDLLAVAKVLSYKSKN